MALYADYCAGCHGAEGQGGYGPALTDLKDRPDAELYEVIAQGVGSMPGLGERLDEAQIGSLIFFLRELSEPASVQAEAEGATRAASETDPAAVSLELTLGADAVVTAEIHLRTAGGDPIANAPVILYRQTAMGGEIPVAEATTDAAGTATLQLTAVRGQSLSLAAAYAGGDRWGPAVAEGNVTIPGSAALPPVVSGLTSPTPPLDVVVILLVVVGGVWTVYGYVVYQLFQIARQRPGDQPPLAQS